MSDYTSAVPEAIKQLIEIISPVRNLPVVKKWHSTAAKHLSRVKTLRKQKKRTLAGGSLNSARQSPEGASHGQADEVRGVLNIKQVALIPGGMESSVCVTFTNKLAESFV